MKNEIVLLFLVTSCVVPISMASVNNISLVSDQNPYLKGIYVQINTDHLDLHDIISDPNGRLYQIGGGESGFGLSIGEGKMTIGGSASVADPDARGYARLMSMIGKNSTVYYENISGYPGVIVVVPEPRTGQEPQNYQIFARFYAPNLTCDIKTWTGGDHNPSNLLETIRTLKITTPPRLSRP